MANEKIMLNDDELESVAGGKKHSKKHVDKTHYACLQCQIGGKMNVPLYRMDGHYVCFEAAHYYSADHGDCDGQNFEFMQDVKSNM